MLGALYDVACVSLRVYFTFYYYKNRAEQSTITNLHAAPMSSVHIFRDVEMMPQRKIL
jgi:hypothetical protein